MSKDIINKSNFISMVLYIVIIVINMIIINKLNMIFMLLYIVLNFDRNTINEYYGYFVISLSKLLKLLYTLNHALSKQKILVTYITICF